MINPSTYSLLDWVMSGPSLDDQRASESQVNTAGANENAGPAAYEQAIQKFVRDGKNPELLQLREGLVRVLDDVSRLERYLPGPPSADQTANMLSFFMQHSEVTLEAGSSGVSGFGQQVSLSTFMKNRGLNPPVNKDELQQTIDALPSKPELPPRTSAGGLRALLQLGNKSV